MKPVLCGDVLRLHVNGVFDASAVCLVLDQAIDCLPPSGPGFGALLLDLSRATAPAGLMPRDLAATWLEQLPHRPCALIRSLSTMIVCRDLASLLASSLDRPTPLYVFNGNKAGEAMQWCVEGAATFRLLEAACRRR